MTDVFEHRNTGKLCTTSDGKEIVWNGHLCEGANLTGSIGDNFCLWTRCGNADVPADRGYEGDIREVTCPACLSVWQQENGQFGAGA